MTTTRMANPRTLPKVPRQDRRRAAEGGETFSRGSAASLGCRCSVTRQGPAAQTPAWLGCRQLLPSDYFRLDCLDMKKALAEVTTWTETNQLFIDELDDIDRRRFEAIRDEFEAGLMQVQRVNAG